jgi:diacylglycerol kinase
VQFSVRARLRSFVYAGRGLASVLSSQHNARIHALASALVCAAGLSIGIDRGDWCALVLAITVVWAAECFNTALEFACDFVAPEFQPLIEKAKDAAAGAVLASALGSALVGGLVFTPHVLRWLEP